MLITAPLLGSLLDDATLVDVLADSKITSVQVGEQLVVAEETNIMIDAARELYRYLERAKTKNSRFISSYFIEGVRKK